MLNNNITDLTNTDPCETTSDFKMAAVKIGSRYSAGLRQIGIKFRCRQMLADVGLLNFELFDFENMLVAFATSFQFSSNPQI